MTDSQTRFAALPLKQKISVIAFFIIGAFVLYEAISIFRGSGSGSATIVPPKEVATKMSEGGPAAGKSVPPKMNPSVTPNNVPSASNPPPAAPHATALLSKPIPETVAPPPTPYVVQQEQAQNNYVSALNELQMLKIQREMAETNQAIIAAKLATVTAEKSITDMLSPEPMAPPPVPIKKESAAEEEANSVVFGSKAAYYTVQSVTMQLDQWHAVLSFKDKLYDVTVGDVLPVDGAVVSAIDQKSVTLQVAGLEQRLPFDSTDSIPAQTPGGGNAGALRSPPPPSDK
jgi:type IV pilus biogenesis protein PilP